MNELTAYLSYLMSGLGLTVLIIWPLDGPGAWWREKVLRRVIPFGLRGALDCYICFGFWSGLLLSPLWWLSCHRLWCWTGSLSVPFLFWLFLTGRSDESN